MDSIVMVSTPNAEIEALKGLELNHVAVVHQEFADYVKGLNMDASGSITLTAYAPDKLTYNVETAKDALAVLSEIWYYSDKGWQAYLDGQPVAHIRANYVLRALKIPAGKHQLEMVFEPRTYQLGSTLSTVFSLLLIVGLIAHVAMQARKINPPCNFDKNTA
ncbi:MAG: YfhO family protein [Saprospiraceae bacterium]